MRWIELAAFVGIVLACYAIFEGIRQVVWKRKMKREDDEFWAAQRAKWALQDILIEQPIKKAKEYVKKNRNEAQG